MKNLQKGFVLPLIIAIIAVLAVGGGVYVYQNKKTESPVSAVDKSSVGPSQSEIDRYNQAVAQRKAEEQPNPPTGYLVPNNVPSQYKLDDKGTRFTSHSTYWSYKGQTETSFGPMTLYLQFSEDTKNTFANYVKTETESPIQTLRVVKEFTYNGSSGVVIGTFPNEKTYENYEKFPSNALEFWLAYDHQGRLFKIHTTDSIDLTPDVLIGLLKKTTVAK